MPMTPGFRLTAGQRYSECWPGGIECADGKVRMPYAYRGKVRSAYFVVSRCANCGAEHLQASRNAAKSKRSFCSRSCRSSRVRAETVGNRIEKKRPHGEGSHVLVKVADHPRMGRHGVVYEHVLVVEASLGRYLSKDERVHHINCVKDDNRLENLHVCADSSTHFRIHGSLNKCVAKLMQLGALRFNSETEQYEVVT